MKMLARLTLFVLAFGGSLACRALGFGSAGDSLLAAAIRYCFRRGPKPDPLPMQLVTASLARIEAHLVDQQLPIAEELPPVPPLLPEELSNGVMALSPDGQRIVCGSPYDGKVRVFDAITKKELWRLPGHADWVVSISISTDSRMATTRSRDGTVKIWNLISGREVKTRRPVSRG